MPNRMIGSDGAPTSSLIPGTVREGSTRARPWRGLDAAIGADSMGHQIQRTGWREGGLARGTGIAERSAYAWW